ncbi:hypothetical protein M758_7G047900 [Ceratodon purpureus]|nr:hypothetical protein M758_7G047900 [Ceratodon purpureus]
MPRPYAAGFLYHSLQLQCMALELSTFQLRPGPWEIRGFSNIQRADIMFVEASGRRVFVTSTPGWPSYLLD